MFTKPLIQRLRLLLSTSLLLTTSTVVVLSQPIQKVPSAEKVVDGHLKAIGGKKKVASILDAAYEYALQSSEGGVGTAGIQTKFPGSYRSEINLEKGQTITAANQRSAWVLQIESGLRTLTGPEASAAKLQAILDAARLVDYKKANVMGRVTGVDNSFGEAAYVVEFSSRAGARLKYFFSTTSRLLVAIQDETRNLTVTFSNYRAEGLILEPHTIRLRKQTGEVILKLQRVVYNSGIAASNFDPPRSAEALDVMELLREVTRNQEAIEKRFSEYSFIRKQTDREIDSKGVVKKETVRVFEVFPPPNRRPIFKLISENGVALSSERAEKEAKRVQDEFIKAEREKEKDAQKAEERKAQREREKAKQKEEDEDVEISLFFRNCEFVSPRREKFQERDAIVFDFRARPGFKPRTRQESLIAKLIGVVWIDPLDKQVIRMEARLAEGFKIGGGLLVSLRPGAALVWEQTRLKEGIWMPLFAQLNISIKVLLFGGGDINQMLEWSDYKHFSSDVEGYKLGQPKPSDSPEKKP